MRNEAAYRRALIPKLERLFPHCIIITNDPQKRQGLPDLLILWGPRWAMLELKRSATAPARPNQPYYVERFNEMSFAAFIFPENEEEVLHELQQALGAFG